MFKSPHHQLNIIIIGTYQRCSYSSHHYHRQLPSTWSHNCLFIYDSSSVFIYKMGKFFSRFVFFSFFTSFILLILAYCCTYCYFFIWVNTPAEIRILRDILESILVLSKQTLISISAPKRLCPSLICLDHFHHSVTVCDHFLTVCQINSLDRQGYCFKVNRKGLPKGSIRGQQHAQIHLWHWQCPYQVFYKRDKQ